MSVSFCTSLSILIQFQVEFGEFLALILVGYLGVFRGHFLLEKCLF